MIEYEGVAKLAHPTAVKSSTAHKSTVGAPGTAVSKKVSANIDYKHDVAKDNAISIRGTETPDLYCSL